MIWDSAPWKTEIRKVVLDFEKRKNQARWPEASLVTIEKNIFYAAYAIRKLIEAFKLSDEAEATKIDGRMHPPRGVTVDILNRDKIDELYDLDVELRQDVSIKDFCNQIIHSFVFVVCFNDDLRGIKGFYVSSDRFKDKGLWYFDLDDVIALLLKVANDEIVYLRMERKGVGTAAVMVRKSRGAAYLHQQ